MPLNNTSYTLITRAANLQDQDAWKTLHEYYRRFIHYILKQIGVAEEDIEDVSQQVLIRLTKDIGKYDKGRARFRTWLSMLISNAAHSHFRKRQTERKHFDEYDHEAVENKTFEASKIESMIEKEWTLYITTKAMERVRKSFKGQAIRAFELSLEGLSSEEIAKKTELSLASVYTLRKRVKKRLYLEVRALTDELEL